jgi:general secretion pathway protein I
MRIFGPTNRAKPRGANTSDAGFTLVEMLVAMVLLSLVGLTLARFQTFQLSGAANLAATAGARLEADNLAVDILIAPAAPTAPVNGTSFNAGRTWHYSITPAPVPSQGVVLDVVQVDIAVGLQPGAPPLATRSLLRGRGQQPAPPQ